MPTSTSVANGFTILELLVVLVIMALLSSIFLVTLGPGNDREERFRQSFSHRVVVEQLSAARRNAQAAGVEQSVMVPGADGREVSATFFPDGSYRGPTLIELDKIDVQVSSSTGLVAAVK